MSTTIFKQEFKMHFKSVLIWSASIAALIFVFGSLYSSFAEDAALLNEMMDKFPPELLMAFGMNGIDMSTILGYYTLLFLFVQICLSIQAATYGFALVSVEEREWTADFLLAKPVARSKIMTSKLLAALCGLTITNLVVWVTTFLVINFFASGRTYDSRTLLLLLASILVFQLFFLAVGLVLSLMVKRVRNVTSYAMALAFGMYLLSVFSDFLGTSIIESITPFKHFEPRAIVQTGAYDTPLVLFNISVIILAIVGSYMLYNRRNIASAV